MGGTAGKLLYILKNIFILAVCATMIWIAFLKTGGNSDLLGTSTQQDENPAAGIIPQKASLKDNRVEYELFDKYDSGLSMASDITIDSSGMLLVVGENQLVVIDLKIGKKVQEVLVHQGIVAICADRWGVAAVSRNQLLYSPGTLYDFQTICTFTADSYLTAVASNGDSLFVADAGLKLIYKISREGSISEHIMPTVNGEKEGFAVMPNRQLDVVVGKRGILWVTNPGKGQVMAFMPDGTYQPSLTWGQFGDTPGDFQGTFNPIQIAMLPNMNFVASEINPNNVKIFDETGKLVSTVAGPNDLPVTLRSLAVTTDENGNVYVLNDRNGDVRAYRIKADSVKKTDVYLPPLPSTPSPAEEETQSPTPGVYGNPMP